MLHGETTKRSTLDPDAIIARLQARAVEQLRDEPAIWVLRGRLRPAQAARPGDGAPPAGQAPERRGDRPRLPDAQRPRGRAPAARAALPPPLQQHGPRFQERVGRNPAGAGLDRGGAGAARGRRHRTSWTPASTTSPWPGRSGSRATTPSGGCASATGWCGRRPARRCHLAELAPRLRPLARVETELVVQRAGQPRPKLQRVTARDRGRAAGAGLAGGRAHPPRRRPA